ncbi:MAG: glycosyltransferase family 2 protein [Phycisphaeraceae bacterium]|nr:glycosyltransferase family 2 protein [Phycisphaerales bacterium]MCB9861448.1 glycosyltransferase family 2 protein [Phycisphaeraceae bacterium]
MALNLSVSLACKNNEATIGRTLDSVRGFAQEIVAADSGSTDGTLALLEDAGAKVVHTPWLGYVKTKQLALDACTSAWVLALDSDESLNQELRDSIKRVIESNEPGVNAGTLNRVVYFRDKPLRHVWQPEWRRRLILRGTHQFGGLDPHDKLDGLPGISVKGVKLSGELRHDSITTFADFFAKQASHARRMALSMQAEGRRGSYIRLVGSPVGSMFKQLVLKRGFLDGYPGWLAAASTSIGTMMKHAILIELDRTRAPDDAGGDL